jgi:sulfur dioxygenase
MIFKQLNPGACRTYLIAAEKSREALLIDPVLNYVETYLQLIEKENLRLSYIIDTHTHADHLSAGPALCDHVQAGYVMHQAAGAPCANYRVRGGEKLRIGDLSIVCEHTPGHTNDSLTLVLNGRLLTGDFLFLGDSGSGRLDLPTGDPGEHFDSLQKLRQYADEFAVYPAHDYHERICSTLGQERQTNPRLRFTSRKEYVQFLSSLAEPTPNWMLQVVQANHACTRDPKVVEIPEDLPCCEVKGTPLSEEDMRGIALITAEQAKRLMDAGGVLALDVRDLDEYSGPLGHIQDSCLIPVQELSARIGEIENSRNAEVITICKTGMRALTAASLLTKAGFTRVACMQGGMVQWNANQYPIAEIET